LPEEAAFAGIAHRRKGVGRAEKRFLKRETAGVKTQEVVLCLQNGQNQCLQSGWLLRYYNVRSCQSPYAAGKISTVGKGRIFVSQTTKRALEASLKKLLLEKPLNKITINDITEDCGVNRMTFYYHFKDIYDLVDWILTEDAVKAMEGRQSFDTWTEAFLEILHQIRDNKTLVLNVYRSVGREQVEQYLYKLLDPMLKEFADRECRDITVQDDDKQFVVDFYKYALVGVVLEWIRRDMKTEPAVMVERMGRMLQGDLRRALCRLASNKIHLEQDG